MYIARKRKEMCIRDRYTVNRVSGRGPAWANSLFEDNAEHGLGMFLGQKAIRDRLIACVERIAARTDSEELKALCTAFLDTCLLYTSRCV